MLIYVAESFLFFPPKWFLLAKQVLFSDLTTSLPSISSVAEKQKMALSTVLLNFKANINMQSTR